MKKLIPGVYEIDCPSTGDDRSQSFTFALSSVDRNHDGNICMPEQLDERPLHLVLKRP